MNSKISRGVLLGLFLTACSSAPKTNTAVVSDSDAKAWLAQYCSKGPRNLNGDLVVKSNTKEFKGQFPAGIHVEPNGSFKMEVTNIIGGTQLQISGHDGVMDITVPPKPQYSRKGVKNYLGIPVPVLTQLLLGDLPCPPVNERVNIHAQGSQMVMQTPSWKWTFEKAEAKSGAVPVRVVLNELGKSPDKAKQIELLIEDWDQDQNYAKKVSVKSPEGESKWTWRSRN